MWYILWIYIFVIIITTSYCKHKKERNVRCEKKKLEVKKRGKKWKKLKKVQI
jgi:hypothetical protein